MNVNDIDVENRRWDREREKSAEGIARERGAEMYNRLNAICRGLTPKQVEEERLAREEREKTTPIHSARPLYDDRPKEKR